MVALFFHAISFNTNSGTSDFDPKITFPEQKILIHGPLDLNQATAEDLDAIPQIGPSLARRIIEYRQAHGPFKDLEQLIQVKGIGERKLKIIEPYVRSGSSQ
ncbi:MAG: helix-hairpin-helix domain-containing protein [Pseudomonadota bacterium]